MAAMHDQLFVTRLLDGGYLSSIAAGRIGLVVKSPPQFGQTPWYTFSTH